MYPGYRPGETRIGRPVAPALVVHRHRQRQWIHWGTGHNLLRKVGIVVVSAVAQNAKCVVTHGPQAAVALEKQAVVASGGNRRDVAGHNLLGLVGGVVSAVAQLAIGVVAHGPQAAVALEKQAVVASGGNRRDVAGDNLLRKVGAVVSAVAQLAKIVVAHGPQTAVALEKQAVAPPCGNRRDAACDNLLGPVGAVVSAVAQLAIAVVAHGPQTAVALEKQAVEYSCGNRRDVAGHNLLGKVDLVVSAVAQLAIIVVAHGPQTVVALEKQGVEYSCGNRCGAAGHNLFGKVGIVIAAISGAVAQLAIVVVAHGPQTAVALKQQAVEPSGGNRCDAAGHNLLGKVGVIVAAISGAVAQLAIVVVAHGPQTAVALEKQAVAVSCSNLGHGLRSAGDRLQHRRTQQPDLNQVSSGFHYFSFGWLFKF